MRRSNLRLWVVAIVVVPLQLVGAPLRAAPKETDDAETLIDAAEIATDEGRHRDAADGYSRAYRKLPIPLRTGPVGAQLITRAVASYKRVAADEGAEALDGCVALLEQHLEDLRTQGKTEQLAALEETLARLRKEVRDRRPGSDAQPEDGPAEPSEEPPPPEVAVTPTPATDRDDDRQRSQRAVGIGLLAAGSVVMAGGAGMLAAGPLLQATAEKRIDDRGGSQEGDEEYLDDARTIRNALLISGGIAAAIGITGIAIGATRLARAKRTRTTAFGLAPTLDGGSLVVSGRF